MEQSDGGHLDESLHYVVRAKVRIDGDRRRAGEEARRVRDDPFVGILPQERDGRAGSVLPYDPDDRCDVVRELLPGYRERPVSERYEKRRIVRTLLAELPEGFEEHQCRL